VTDALGSDKIGLYLIEPSSGRPTEIHVRHLPDSFVAAYEELGRDDDKILACVMRTRRASYDAEAFPGDAWKQSHLYRRFAIRYRIHHYLCAPIVGGGRCFGTLNLGRASDGATFDATVAARATKVGRAIGAQLARLQTSPPDETARLRALRALVRAKAAELETAGVELSATDTEALWRALEYETPLDVFDRGDRRFVLIDRGGATTREHPALSRREGEILACVGVGKSDKEIAFELGISASTVSTHLSSVRRKLGCRARVQLVDAARRR
jgi:DNA-binding CsgD family transcriptional regulator